MNYPPVLPLKVLLSERVEYSALKPHLSRISLLTEGGYKLREAIATFLERRPGEPDEVYRIRLTKFSYSNVLGSAMSQLATKFSGGTIHLSGESDTDFWDSFRENNDGKGRTEAQLVSQIFSALLPYRKIFVHIDKPASSIIPLSAAQEEALGLSPHVTLYNALQVPAWAEQGKGLLWAKIYQASDVAEGPLSPSLTKATWTFIDTEKVVKYSAFVIINAGIITQIIEPDGETRSLAMSESPIRLESEIQHGFGQIPLIKVEVPETLWAGNHAYAMAEKCLRLECHHYDYLTATYPQRTFKRVQRPDSDLDDTFVDADNDGPETGLPYVLELDSFTWNEPTGAILDKVAAALDQTSKDIRSMLSIGGAYIQEAVEASGKSKEMDFVNEVSRLQAYGLFVADALQDIYQMVAIAAGQPSDAIAINGLNEFADNRLSDMVQALQAIALLDVGKLQTILSPTLFGFVRSQLASFFMSNLTPGQKGIIEGELEAPLVIPKPEPPSSEGASEPEDDKKPDNVTAT